MGVEIAPSLLSANFAKLGQEVKKISNLGVDYIHIDVMDGNFVPNITIGPNVISAIRKYSDLPFDIHLMVKSPANHIEGIINAGADIVTIHAEAEIGFESLVRKIKLYKNVNNIKKTIKVGVSIIPSTSPRVLECIIHELDIVLIMTVKPGFSGQKFIYSQLQKISIIKEMIKKRNLKTKISVDGGVNLLNKSDIISAGADILVIGSAIFGSSNIEKAVRDFRKSL